MIEKIILDYLKSSLNIDCYMEEPVNVPDKYIIIEKTSGGEENHIQTATIAIQSYAPTLYQAADLNEKVKTSMKDIILLDSICKSQLNSDYNFTDTTKKKYRYQAVYDLIYY